MADLPNTPETRREQFLNAIATGDTSGLPEPVTREEVYLDYIAKNGGGGGGGQNLGALAYKNSASGTYTPQGEVTRVDLVTREEYKFIDLIDDVGTLPSITYDSETESLSFSAGTLPTTKTDSILTGITFNPQPQQIIGRESIITVS